MLKTQFHTTMRWLLRANTPIPERSDGEIAADMERNYHWNFTTHVLDGVFFWLGASFMSSATIIPLFVSKLSDSPWAIGLAAVIAQAGWYFPQLFAANATERLPLMKPVVVNLGFFLERLPLWLLPIAALVGASHPQLGLALFFIGYAGHILGAGAVAPAWQDLVARCFFPEQRGRYFGTATFLGNGTGLLGAALSAWILAAFLFPTNFALLFTLAAFFVTVSWVFLALVREPTQSHMVARQSTRQYLGKLPAIVQQDEEFRRFLLARTLLVFGSLGTGFVTVAAIARWEVADGVVGFYTGALLLGQTLGTFVFGFLSDRRGNKLVLESSAAFGMFAFLLAWMAPFAMLYYAVFFMLGIAMGGIMLSSILVVLEFAPSSRRPTYTGLANTTVGAFSIAAPLLGALLASISYDWLFAVSAGFNLVALVALHWWVKEPRQLKPVPTS
ncbi:MAG: MFS transporter [Chloroflexota bacterium]|nr:MFS transporter [Chloroflexota bacterium]